MIIYDICICVHIYIYTHTTFEYALKLYFATGGGLMAFAGPAGAATGAALGAAAAGGPPN